MPHRVSASDVAFLAAKSSCSPLHVATVAILDPGTMERLQELVDSASSIRTRAPRGRKPPETP